MNCLLVDDDIDDLEIFSFALKELDKPVRLVSLKSGAEALQVLTEDRTFVPDCIFLDLNMPRMNGKDCLSELRRLPWLQDVPIIIYTTSSQESDRLEVQKLGATDFMSKETSIAALKNSLNTLFQRHRI